jgi:uncharacterized damage-inducible protein DinB
MGGHGGGSTTFTTDWEVRMRRPRLPSSITLSLAFLALPVAAGAQGPALGPIDATRAGFAEVADWIVRAAESVPEAQYGYKPTDAVRTFGQVVGHVADGNNYYCARATGTNREWAETVALSGAGKAELLAQLKQSIAACTAAHTAANAARVAPLIANYGHASLHYGNVVTYLRMMGITPPSS